MTSTPSIERRFGQASLDCDELRRSRLHPRLGLVLGGGQSGETGRGRAAL